MNNIMKKILLLACMFVAGICFSSCTKDDGNGGSSSGIEGMWACTAEYWSDDDDAEYEHVDIYKSSTEYLLEFANGVIKEYEADNEVPFVNGYVKGSLNDFELGGSALYQMKGNEIFVGGFKFFDVEFIGKDKIKLIDEYNDYSLYERVKGFN